MAQFAAPPVSPMHLRIRVPEGDITPAGPVLVRRMSDLAGVFADPAGWQTVVEDGDPVVYTVASSPVPELPGELPQSVTTIMPGRCGGEFFLTRGHQHPEPQGEIYLGLSGRGGVLHYDGSTSTWTDIEPGAMAYIPPGWAHRSVNVGDEPYRFLAVYPGSAGHDYEWVRRHGMGARVMAGPGGAVLAPFGRG